MAVDGSTTTFTNLIERTTCPNLVLPISELVLNRTATQNSEEIQILSTPRNESEGAIAYNDELVISQRD